MMRREVKQKVVAELRSVRRYRAAIRHGACNKNERQRMAAWVSVADEMLQSLEREDTFTAGSRRADFARLLFALDAAEIGTMRYIMTVASERFNVTVDGLYRWRDDAIFIAAIKAATKGLL